MMLLPGKVKNPCGDCVTLTDGRGPYCTMNCSPRETIPDTMKEMVERAFLPLDALVCVTAPDAPKQVMDAWESIMEYLGPEFEERRKKKLKLSQN